MTWQYMNTANIEWIPASTLTTPPSGLVRVYKNLYWIASPNGDLAFYSGPNGYLSPQANTSLVIAERFRDNMFPTSTIVFIPVVFVKAHPDDY